MNTLNTLSKKSGVKLSCSCNRCRPFRSCNYNLESFFSDELKQLNHRLNCLVYQSLGETSLSNKALLHVTADLALLALKVCLATAG
jgi:hypothetical protein